MANRGTRETRKHFEMSRKTLTLHLSKRMDKTLGVRAEKARVRVEDLAVHHAAVATTHPLRRPLPQRVRDGVLDEPLSVEVQSQNAAGQLAHVEVLEVDQEQPHYEEVPGHDGPADAYSSRFRAARFLLSFGPFSSRT